MGGAFNGDTIIKYNEFTNGDFKKIYAFEPDKSNLEILKDNMRNLDNVEIIAKGIWKQETILKFNSSGSGSCIEEVFGEDNVKVTTIDSTVKDDKVTFIKMDIEGSELEALEGAKKTIKNNMPKLAICCYHKADDIINFYSYLKTFSKGNIRYKFYLRHHSNSVYETVLYAIPVELRANVIENMRSYDNAILR